MPALDAISAQVKNALIKDGWTITADPYTITYEDAQLFADLAAERPIAAERGTEKIVVEIKSFLRPSVWNDLQSAIGQYEIYRVLLEETDPEYRLLLAVRSTIYERAFLRKAISLVLGKSRIAYFAVDLEREEVVVWNEPDMPKSLKIS